MRTTVVGCGYLGAAFKPYSNDIRRSPASYIASKISGRGANVTIMDLEAGNRVRVKRPNLRVVDNSAEAFNGADVVLPLTATEAVS